MKLKKIISGGQTGVDRAALDAAIENNFPYGGFCPKGRLAEDGEINSRYLLTECATANYAERTRLNVEHSDGTLILCSYELEGGTAMTLRYCIELNKPYLIINPEADTNIENILSWILNNKIEILNVAGPRASKDSKIYDLSSSLLTKLIKKASSYLKNI